MAFYNSLRRLSFATGRNFGGVSNSVRNQARVTTTGANTVVPDTLLGNQNVANAGAPKNTLIQNHGVVLSNTQQIEGFRTLNNFTIQQPSINHLGYSRSSLLNNYSIGGNSILTLPSGIPVPSILTPALAISKRFYHEKVLDHFKDPRNVGQLDKKKKSVGTALVGKASCGDVIKMSIEVDDKGTIKDAKFKTFGCGSAIASSSLATEMIIGKSIDDAEKLKNTDIANHLNLPPVKIHCSVLAEEAIRESIKDYKKKNDE